MELGEDGGEEAAGGAPVRGEVEGYHLVRGGASALGSLGKPSKQKEAYFHKGSDPPPLFSEVMEPVVHI